jgi:hypothetical protein
MDTIKAYHSKRGVEGSFFKELKKTNNPASVSTLSDMACDISIL